MNQASHQRTLMGIEEIKIDKNTLTTYQKVQKYFKTNYQKINNQQIFVKVNPIRSLIADNLVKGKHWWSNFWKKLVIEDSEEYLFNQLFFNREGLLIMADNNEDKQYLIFITVFQQAMRGYFAKIYSKTEEGKNPPIKKKVERLRAELNYCYDELSFKEYLSDFLVRGGLNKYFNHHQEEIALLIKKSSWQELRIWALLAIASYKPKDKPTNSDDNSLTNNQKIEEINDE